MKKIKVKINNRRKTKADFYCTDYHCHGRWSTHPKVSGYYPSGMRRTNK